MLPLDGSVVLVHMAVFSCFIGSRLQTSPGCYLENHLGDLGFRLCPFDAICVGYRSPDQFNCVRLEVLGLTKSATPEDGGVQEPNVNDVSLTCRGHLMIRMIWNGGTVWNQRVETKLRDICQAVADRLAVILK
jgi:hypothetical protein